MDIDIVKGDISEQNTDIIVNAANESLLGGSGVDGAIHKVAGPDLLLECKRIGFCKTGEAVITKAYNLKSKFIIHTVGPVWDGGNNNEDKLLRDCYQNVLKLAESYKMGSIAFPAISTGVYGFPLERASRIAINTVYDFAENVRSLNKVVFVCFDETAFLIYKKISERINNGTL